MLVEIAVGDAYGAGMEYVPSEFLMEHNNLNGYVAHPTHHALKAGQYTDDTQMSIAVAETLLMAEDIDRLTKKDFIKAFFHTFKRDPRDGYSRAFQTFLEEVESPEQFEATIISNSTKSGGAMRAGPVGLLSSLDQVNRIAALQASITHDTDLGKDAAKATALSVYYCRNRIGKKSDLDKFLNKFVPGYKWSEDWSGKITSTGIYHVRAATTLIRKLDSLSNILHAVVAFEGDVDTAAAIAMAIGSQSEEIDNDLPEILYANLERGKYGFNYLEDLDYKLMEKF